MHILAHTIARLQISINHAYIHSVYSLIILHELAVYERWTMGKEVHFNFIPISGLFLLQ